MSAVRHSSMSMNHCTSLDINDSSPILHHVRTISWTNYKRNYKVTSWEGQRD